jgi:glycosyltransferase involved in cell wall biosynthesis
VTEFNLMRKKLDYLCLQPTRQGQASHAHVNEIVAGLRRRGWEVRLVEPPHPRPGRADGLRRAVAAATTQLTYWVRCGFRPAPFVYIRAHFLSLPTALLARAAGSIVVQEVNGPTDDAFDAWPQLWPLRRLLEFASRAQLRLADAVVVVTPGLEEYVRTVTGRRSGLYVIGNGANVDRFRPAGSAYDPSARAYVVFVGVLASWQGIDTVLAAVESDAWPPTVDLVIAGDGKERGRIELAAKASGRIRWLGTIPYGESPALVAASLAALVPKSGRRAYGLSPLKLFEAMACGVPVVASDLPGLSDIVRAHDCGITFAAGDAEALARSVGQLAADPARARAMGARGRKAAVALYSWDARADQTEQVLLQVAGKRASRGRSAATTPPLMGSEGRERQPSAGGEAGGDRR